MPFCSSCIGLVGAPGPVREVPRLRKIAPNRYAMLKYGIERGREIEQRIQQLVAPLSRRSSQPIAAVVLNRADPVDVRGQRVEVERQALRRRRRTGTYRTRSATRCGARIGAVARDLQHTAAASARRRAPPRSTRCGPRSARASASLEVPAREDDGRDEQQRRDVGQRRTPSSSARTRRAPAARARPPS